MKNIFVTVGTTEFDSLLNAVTSTKVLDHFVEKGYTHLTLQKGRGQFELSKENHKCLKIECFDYKDSIAGDMNEASLVISHAGAGSILETLSLWKPLIVVVNEELMDNHQFELASKMADEGYLFYCTCASLLETLQTKDLTQLKHKQPVDEKVFGNFLNEFVGIVSS
ncbi:UDP-N-acetylglucosamine transferase subunit ALG13-like [Clytia hemisphaerica]|uniref:UDP-N-acetylglucosamine transferase subunit ALG13-like n=1 Tax=Clytia hemisphaerica TaxID=252671 RepID=UPI0034D3C7D1